MSDIRVPVLVLWGVFFAGLATAYPGQLGTSVATGGWPRVTDLLNFACAGVLALTILTNSKLHRAFLSLLLIWALTTPWVFMEIYALGGAPDPAVQRLLARWVLCGFSAFAITVVVQSPALRWIFFSGFLAGASLSAATVLYDYLTFSPTDVPVEVLVTLAIYDGKDLYDFVYRAFGIFGHPNAAAGCVLLSVPVFIGAIQEGRWPRWSIVLPIALMGGIYYLTKSRGPLAVSAGLVGYWAWIEARGIRIPLMLAGTVTVLGILMAGDLAGSWGGEVLVERLFDIDGIAVNAADRWWTIATSLELILWNPLGMGSAYVAPLEVATGTSATHSAYLELALMGGVPLAVVVFVRLGTLVSLLFTQWRPVEAWLAAYLIGIFAFESYFQQITIQLITLWLVLSPVATFSRAIRESAVPTRRPPVMRLNDRPA